MNSYAISVYEQDLVRAVTGRTIRPGGFTLTDRALAFCAFPEDSTILDAGCGCGATVEHIRSRWHLNAVGVDISAMLLSAGLASGYLPLVRATACRLPFRSNAMEGLTCECVLSIMADPQKALAEYHRVLKIGGCLILSDICLRKIPASAEGARPENAIPVSSCFSSAVSVEQRSRQIESAGFSILRCEDHTKLLKELAARFVFEHGSLKKFWEQILPCSGPCHAPAALSGGKPGYALWIAQKTEGSKTTQNKKSDL